MTKPGVTGDGEDEHEFLLRSSGPGLLDRIVALALRNRMIVALLLVLVTAVGLRSLSVLPIDAVPDVTNVQVQVLTRAPGLGPLEVERLITTPIEVGMGGLPKLAQMRSVSRFGLSAITLVFDEGTDLYWARQLVGEHLSEAKLPEGMSPELGPPATGLGEIFQFEVTGDPGVSLMDLRDTLEWQVVPALQQVPGVVETNTFGGELRTFTVEVHPDQLAARGLALGDLYEALERNNLTVGGGAIERGPEQTLLRGVAQLGSVADVAGVLVKTTDAGIPITVGQVAEVREAPMQRQGAMTRDGTHEGVAGIALMGVGENSRVVAERLRTAVDELRPSLPKGQHLDVYYDRTELVDRTIDTVGHNLLEGAVLVVAVLLLTLGNLRGGLIAAAAIPFAMLVAFTGMVLAGVSGNLMSLGAIDFGLIVDGAVVMVEASIHAANRRQGAGADAGPATFLGAARSVARPVAFAVGIIALVYVPLLSLSGVEGKMFRPMALTVVFALIGSLVYALVVVPVLATATLRDATERETMFMRVAHRMFHPALDGVLRRPLRAAAAATLTVAAAVAVLPFMGAEFIPTLDEGALGIEVNRQASSSVEEAVRETRVMEATLMADFPDEVATIVSRTGAAEISTDPDGLEKTDVVILEKPRNEWTRAHDRESLIAAMQADLARKAPGMNFYFSQPIEQRTNELIEGVRADVALVVHGDDLAVLRDLGEQLARVVSGVRGVDTVKIEKTAGLPVLTAEVKPAAVARLGIDAVDVLDAVAAVGGREAGEVVVGQRRYPLQIRFPQDVRNDPERLAAVAVGRSDGARVPLGQVATLRHEEGPVQVSHEGGTRRLTVEVNVRGRDIASFVAEARARIATSVTFPSGYRLAWGGTFENLEGAAARLEVLVPLVLLLIFVLLQAEFGSARMALLVYANVPVAASGGIFALALRGLPLSISAGVGFITLFGISVLNGIVLLSHMRALRAQGYMALEAARLGARERLRTVMMTTLVAALGFVPMAFATSAGAEVQRPLATVVIGGLLTSTLLTLFVLPGLYARWMPPDAETEHP